METTTYEMKFEAGSAGAFTGMASVYGNVDRDGDRVERGAFAKSIEEAKANGIPLLWAHNPQQPIGIITELEETDTGLLVKGRFVLDSQEASSKYALAKAGAVRGLSIGFITKAAQRDPANGVRTITEIDLREVSLVTFPANELAGLTSLKEAAVVAASKEEGDMPDDIKTGDQGTPETKAATIDDVKAIADQISGLEAKMNRPSVPAAPKDDVETKAFDQFLRTGAVAPGMETKDLTLGSGGTAGFLAPEQYIAELVKDIVEFSPVRQAARVSQMNASTARLPKRTGRLNAVWVGETEARTETEPSYGDQTFTPHEMACYVDLSNQALEDSAFNIEAELRMDFAEEFGQTEGTAFVTGDGNGKPTGFTTAAVTEVTSGSAGTFDADDLIDLFHAIKTPYAQRGAWMMSRATIAAARKLKDGQDQYILNMQGLNGVPTTTILGRPVVEVPDLPGVATAESPIWFGDFNRFYRIFDRVELQVMRDPYSQAANGMTRFHARRRVAGAPLVAEAVAKLTIG